jgi:tRNA 2-thiouridine synthesizing protein E
LNAQDWSQEKSARLAEDEGISLNNEHWAVIAYLRHSYIEDGLPRFARTTARALNRQFSAQGGSKYLYGLFAGGPVTQGSRLATTCAHRQAPPTFRLAPAIEKYRSGMHEESPPVGH